MSFPIFGHCNAAVSIHEHFLYKHIFLIVLDMYRAVELLCIMVTLCWIFWRIANLFFTMSIPVHISTGIFPVGVKCYFIVVWVFISQMTNDTEHFYVLIGHFYIIFGKRFIQIFCPFSVSLCILNSRLLSKIWLQIFFPILEVFTSLMMSFDVAKFTSDVQFIYFFICGFWCHIWEAVS